MPRLQPHLGLGKRGVYPFSIKGGEDLWLPRQSRLLGALDAPMAARLPPTPAVRCPAAPPCGRPVGARGRRPPPRLSAGLRAASPGGSAGLRSALRGVLLPPSGPAESSSKKKNPSESSIPRRKQETPKSFRSRKRQPGFGGAGSESGCDAGMKGREALMRAECRSPEATSARSLAFRGRRLRRAPGAEGGAAPRVLCSPSLPAP